VDDGFHGDRARLLTAANRDQGGRTRPDTLS
jgi:hypothetical protein